MSADRYEVLDDPSLFDPPIYRCQDCGICLTNTGIHDRWHSLQKDRNG